MGFGYNPDLVNFGERLDILSFFSWMKRLQESLGLEWTIFDASGYAIVNRTPSKKIVALGENPTAEQILDVLVSEQEQPKRAEIMENCELRSQYLKRLVDITKIRGEYVDSRRVFRESGQYTVALDYALELVSKLKAEAPELVGRIQPANAKLSNQLYLPLEIAEAIYLWNTKKVNGKFGPTTEKDFDEAILKAFEEKGDPYQTFRCSYGPRRPGYLGDRNVLWTSSPDKFVDSVLSVDQKYRNFVTGYLQPFLLENETLESCVIRMRNQLKLERGI